VSGSNPHVSKPKTFKPEIGKRKEKRGKRIMGTMNEHE
jgi:hypothetical protein